MFENTRERDGEMMRRKKGGCGANVNADMFIFSGCWKRCIFGRGMHKYDVESKTKIEMLGHCDAVRCACYGACYK
jgi:hypothetical protein